MAMVDVVSTLSTVSASLLPLRLVSVDSAVAPYWQVDVLLNEVCLADPIMFYYAYPFDIGSLNHAPVMLV